MGLPLWHAALQFDVKEIVEMFESRVACHKVTHLQEKQILDKNM